MPGPKVEAKAGAVAKTDPKAGGWHQVDDYTEPVTEVIIRTTYRKITPRMTLAQARAQGSAYGKGQTLQDHEASHAADAIAFLQSSGPRLVESRGLEVSTFNDNMKAFNAAVLSMTADISAYSRGKTDCRGPQRRVLLGQTGQGQDASAQPEPSHQSRGNQPWE